MSHELQEVEQESREARGSESTESSSIFTEAYGLLALKQFRADDALPAGFQSYVEQTFGTVELYDSQATREPTFSRDGPKDGAEITKKPVGQIVEETVKQIPEQLGKTLDASREAWRDPVGVVEQAAEDAGRLWSQIRDGKRE